MTFLSLVIALSILVFVHELGHYLAAKRSRIVVEEFGFGYPPRLFAFWQTAGRITVEGQEIIVPRRFKMPEGIGIGSRVVYHTSTRGKGRLVLTDIREAGEEDQETTPVGRVDFWNPGTLFSVNSIPFGGFAKMRGEEDPSAPGSLASKGKLVRLGVLAAGAAMNLLLAILFFSLSFGLGAPALADPQNAVVDMVAPGSPAEAAGLQPGDIVLRVDDTEVLTVRSLQEYTQAHLGKPILLQMQRGEEMLEVSVVPRIEPPPGEGPMGIALRPRMTVKRYPWYEAIWAGLRQTLAMMAFILTVPIQVIRGLIPAELARPVGPVGVGQLVGDAVRYSLDTGWWFPVMQMMGSLGVALAVTNLLPLPGLDGGRILFVLVEGIRGQRVAPAKEGLIHLIGMMLLVALMLFITWQDVVNPLPAIDWTRLF